MFATDYEAAREMALTAHLKLEKSPYANPKLLSFMELLAPNGVRFPNKETEHEFRKFVTYPDNASNTRIAASYFITLTRMLEKTETRREKELSDSRINLESLAG